MKDITALQGIEITSGRRTFSFTGAVHSIGRALDSEVSRQVAATLLVGVAFAGVGYLGVFISF